MNYNKLFLISLSLIYSANVFSNTDSPSPNVGNSVESNQEIQDPNNNFNSKRKEYVERVVSSLPQYEHAQQPIEFNSYITPIHRTRNSADMDYIVAAPIFDEIIASLTKNSDSTVHPPQASVGLNISGATIEQKKEMLRYLKDKKSKIIDLSKRANNQHRQSLEVLNSNIDYFIQHIENNINRGNESGEIIITRNDSIKEPLNELFLKKNIASLHELTDMKMSFDDSLLRLDSTLNQTSTELADTRTDLTNTRTELSELDKTVKKHREDVEEQGKEITQVKQTAGTNKIYVDKYLVNDFDVNEQSKSLVGHLGSLYAGNKSNTDNINAIRNDLSHFKNETNNRFYKVEKRANQGIASVAAMSNLPFNDAATFSTAMGIGNYRNATAFAWGMQYRINENVKVKASTAWNDANNWVSAGGIGISW
ncbi:TPA: YadA C-terminal domain-containing protein [Proteus mirabilis]|uniref:YadA C-terminal domain-containing protein n=1 Tax=Proteus sp. G2674 TaxID=2698886 RepID=UPI001F242A60|nr:YadA C-terminal domain-containing protein [Proteus sp. G2674]